MFCRHMEKVPPLHNGEYTRPSRMITHNWANLFRDLVAAILSSTEACFELVCVPT